MTLPDYTISLLEKIRQEAPLIHNITNFVVMNHSANVLLALGASPVMAHCADEVQEMVSFSGALVLNIGTLQEDWVASMVLAGKAANARGIPVVLDPVGAGATRLRTEAAKRILGECQVAVLRGNASEVLSLQSSDIKTKGVDSSMEFSDNMVETAKIMAKESGSVIAISGPEDCITDGERVFRVANGQPLMTKVTGSGCGLSAVVGAFCAVGPEDSAKAAAAAFGYYGLCGDLAIQISDRPGSFAVAFVDQLYGTSFEQVSLGLKVRMV